MRLPAILVFALFTHNCYAQERSQQSIVVSLDPPQHQRSKVTQQFRCNVEQELGGSAFIYAYQLHSNGDSVRLYALRFRNIQVSTGAYTQTFDLAKGEPLAPKSAVFFEVLRRFGALPPGQYSTRLVLQSSDTLMPALSQTFLWSVDSVLSPYSSLHGNADRLLGAGTLANSNGGLLQQAQQKVSGASPATTGQAVPISAAQTTRMKARLQRGLAKTADVFVQTQNVAGKTYSLLYYEGWFLGRYELATQSAIQQRAASAATTLQGNASSLVQNSLEDFRSVSAQMRELQESRRRTAGRGALEGVLDMNTALATRQEPGSEQDNAFTELLGAVSTEVMDIPVSVEGYYTTQDRGRQAKASYIRFRYDAEKAKSELARLIGDYRRKYSETVAKGKGLEQVYGSYLRSLENEQTALRQNLRDEYGLDEQALLQTSSAKSAIASMPSLSDTAALLQRAANLSGADTSAAAERLTVAHDKALARRAEAQKRYAELVALREKIARYQTLLTQYQQGLQLDSAIDGTKLQALSERPNASYKDMAKAAAGLLPEGQSKRFASGLTHLEAGILNKYESSYTWAGQTARGGSVGYDLGVAQVSATVGKTEYVSRSGVVDRYSAYSGRADFEPLKDQKLSLIYYGYSPSRSMITDERFSRRGVDLALPTFTAPTHILSLVAEGAAVRSSLIYTLEVANSYQKGESIAGADGRRRISMDNSALKAALAWTVPKTSASLKGEWEHLGREFQNSALTVARVGTSRYTAGGSVGLLREALTVSVQYNLLRQEAFASTGYSRRWGFEVRTRSKRYPAVVLSYKPFATFRAYDDTLLGAEQRPLIGEVWTGRGNYQIKRPGGTVHRFSLLYNQNSTASMDTVAGYRSATAQVLYLVTSRGATLSLNGGWMVAPVVVADGLATAVQRTMFAAASWSKQIGKRATAGVGSDAALAPFGWQRVALTLSGAYTLPHQPLSLRLQTRYALIRSDPAGGNDAIGAALIGASWRFRTKPLLRSGSQSTL